MGTRFDYCLDADRVNVVSGPVEVNTDDQE